MDKRGGVSISAAVHISMCFCAMPRRNLAFTDVGSAASAPSAASCASGYLDNQIP